MNILKKPLKMCRRIKCFFIVYYAILVGYTVTYRVHCTMNSLYKDAADESLECKHVHSFGQCMMHFV